MEADHLPQRVGDAGHRRPAAARLLARAGRRAVQPHIIALDAIDFGLAVGGRAQIPRWYHWTFKQLMTMFLWGFESGWSRSARTTIPTCGPTPPAILARCCSIGAGRSCCASSCCRFSRCGITTRRRSSSPKPPPTSRSRATPTASRACATRSRELGSMLVPLIIAKNEPQQVRLRRGGPTGTFWGIAFGGFAVAAAFGYLSILLARRLPRASARPQALRLARAARPALWAVPVRGRIRKLGKGVETIAAGTGTVLGFVFALATTIGDSRIYTYLFADGDTDDGSTRRFAGRRADQPGRLSRGVELAVHAPVGQRHEAVRAGNIGVSSHYPDASSQQNVRVRLLARRRHRDPRLARGDHHAASRQSTRQQPPTTGTSSR